MLGQVRRNEYIFFHWSSGKVIGIILLLCHNLILKCQQNLEQLHKSNRDDLVEAEAEQIKILQEFLPAQLSEAEIEAAVVQAIEVLGATSVRDMGKVMGKLVPQRRGKADNSVVSQIVRQKLS